MTTSTAGTARSTLNQIRLLKAKQPTTGRVLSAYLDTSPVRTDKQAYLIAFRDGCKTIRADLDAREQAAFEQAVRQAERTLASTILAGHAGLAVFTSGANDYNFAVPLPRRVTDEVAWGSRPLIGPLDEVLVECQRVAVALFDKERTRILSIFFGEIEEKHTIVDDVPGKQATGGWFALAQSRYARHHEDHVLRHAKRTIRELTALHQERPFDRLLLGGPAEATALLRQHLPRPLRARLAGTLSVELFASDAVVLRAALAAADLIERREEQEAVEELLDAATTPHTTLGLRQTLEALYERRIHRLFVADSFGGTGGECPACGRLVPGPERCPLCGTPTQALGDLRERIVDLTEHQGAHVEFVSGPAATLLAAYDGIGAWTHR